MFFSCDNALGCIYQAAFKPVSHQLIALVLTAVRGLLFLLLSRSLLTGHHSKIRHALKNWETGYRLKHQFTAAHYKVYDQYFDALTQFDEGAMKRFWAQHRRDIFKNGL